MLITSLENLRKRKTMLKKYKVKYNLHHYPEYSENKEIVIEAHSKEEAEEEFRITIMKFKVTHMWNMLMKLKKQMNHYRQVISI